MKYNLHRYILITIILLFIGYKIYSIFKDDIKEVLNEPVIQESVN